MSFLLEIAWTHVSSRIRQTFIGVLGVATGVGFTIMLAGLMQGGQKDFIHMLVDTMPHVTVTDERISTANQPAEQVYGASHSRQSSGGGKTIRDHKSKPGDFVDTPMVARLNCSLNQDFGND